MGGLDRIVGIYNTIIRIGITDELSFSESLRIETCNLFNLIALPGLLVHFFYNLFGPNIGAEYVFMLIYLLIFSITFSLNYFRKHTLAKLHAILTPLILIGCIHALSGWNLRMEPVYLMLILSSIYFFKRKLAFTISAIILLVYLLVIVVLQYTVPPLENQILVTAPFIYFSFSIVSSVILTIKVLVENSRFNLLAIRQNKVLEEKNKELERFAHIASHDLKSPLRNVISFSGLIHRDLERGDHDSIQEYLEFIQSSANQMSFLIKDILEFSTINDHSQAEKKWLDLNQVFEKVQYTLRQEIEEKQVAIISEELPFYFCNEAMFSLLFQHLIQNGIKYNEHNEPIIQISCTERKNTLVLQFQDNGIGIEAKHQDKIFDYFKRLHSVADYQGTGIGLGLCKKIIQYYDGTIDVISEPGEGSTFIIEIPMVYPAHSLEIQPKKTPIVHI